MLYEKSKTQKLDVATFQNPPAEFRGAPFWAWNGKLDKDVLLWQIEQLKKMGFGGYFIHTRCGLSTPYLGEEFMSLIKACVQKGKDCNMLSYLYDEDRWPSGAAGGLVTKDKRYRKKNIVFSPLCPKEYQQSVTAEEEPVFLAAYDVELDEVGNLLSYQKIGENDGAKHKKWYVYRTFNAVTGWYNGFTYIDILSDEAVKKFIDVTYEAYKRELGNEFGKAVPAIFTDEPQFHNGEMFPAFAAGDEAFKFTWTDDFADTFKSAKGYDIFAKLPEINWTKKDEAQTVRYDYFDHVTARFERAFSKQIGDWCAKNGIAFTGHLMHEEALERQMIAVGETMRHYGHYGIPGIDMLCNSIELSTAKQTQSAVHQYGKPGMTSELYGVTGWDFDFRGHKFQGDWQAALGVTLRVPHLSWVSMKGSAKRDYPASISYQSAWYQEYPLVEDHFARLNTVLTRGKPVVNVGVVHPIESAWMEIGAVDITSEARERVDGQFNNLLHWLLLSTLDFDFVAESLVPTLHSGKGKGFDMGEMQYKAILVPPVVTLRSTTVKALNDFLDRGGKVIVTGAAPAYVDGLPSREAKALFDRATKCDFSSADIQKALMDEREIEIVNDNGKKSNNLLYQMREDGDCKWLFLARAVQQQRYDGGETHPQRITVKIKGEYFPEVYNTVSGEVESVAYWLANGNTFVKKDLYASDSLLLRLGEKRKQVTRTEKEQNKACVCIDFPDKVAYKLSEPNVLVLDMCEYSLDGKTWEKKDEILRIDYNLRQKFNYPNADGCDVQPWMIEEEAPDKFLYLKFTFESEIDCPCALAFEEATEVVFNGEKVDINVNGWYIDRDIKTTALPAIHKGKNVLIVRAPFSKRISLENMFILGEFGVAVEGRNAKITALPQKISFGSLASQGFPFYGAGITYQLPVTTNGEAAEIVADYFEGAVLTVAVDGKRVGRIAYAPYSLNLGKLKRGEHMVELTLVATRINTCGALHDATGRRWKSSNMWYTYGLEWSYEYCLTRQGVIKSPEIKLYK